MRPRSWWCSPPARCWSRCAAALLNEAVAKADDTEDPPAGMWLVIQRWGAPNQLDTSPGLPPGLPVLAALDQVRRTGQADARDVTVGRQHYRVHTGVQRLLSTRAQLLRRAIRAGAGDAHAKAEADRLVAEARELAAILEDLLLTADQRQPPALAVDLAALAEDVAGAAAVEASGITVSGPTTTRALVSGSPVALRRALTALVDNALRHASGTVRVDIRSAGGMVVVEVSDDGPGIDPAIEHRLFDRFATAPTREPTPEPTAEPEPTSAPGPTAAPELAANPASGPGPESEPPESGGRPRYGLGLALVGEIAARHHGTLASVGSPGQGATLRLSLPTRPIQA